MSTMYRAWPRPRKVDRKWMMFNGPVDAIWIENMNTVLDDNKKLCLVSGESIKMPGEMAMMFEVEDLLVASPATVSRVGIIYIEPKALGLDPLIQSWLTKTCASAPSLGACGIKSILLALFDTYLYPSLSLMRLYSNELAPTCENNVTESLMRLLDCFLEPFYDKEGREPQDSAACDACVETVEARFLFALVWSVGCTGTDVDRKRFDAYLRAHIATREAKFAFPHASDVYSYVWDQETKKWQVWMDTIDDYKVELSF